MDALSVLTNAQVRSMFPGATEAGFATDEMRALIQVLDAVAEAIKALREVPSGHLYARMQSMMSLTLYTAIIGFLKRAGLVEEQAHLLRWVGGE